MPVTCETRQMTTRKRAFLFAAPTPWNALPREMCLALCLSPSVSKEVQDHSELLMHDENSPGGLLIGFYLVSVFELL